MTENIGELVAEHPLFSGLPMMLPSWSEAVRRMWRSRPASSFWKRASWRGRFSCSGVATWRSRCTSLAVCPSY